MKSKTLTDLEIAIKLEEIEKEETMKQTAVDWLVDQVENYNCMKLGLIPSDIIEKAKQMEKEQIIDVFKDAYDFGYYDNYNYSAEQYYKETYGKDA